MKIVPCRATGAEQWHECDPDLPDDQKRSKKRIHDERDQLPNASIAEMK